MMDSLDGLEVSEPAEVVLASEVLEPYVLTWQLGDIADGEGECSVLAIMRRADGFLLAMPPGFLPEDVVAAGNGASMTDMFGPSTRLVVPAVISEYGQLMPTGSDVEVLVVDCQAAIATHLRRYSSAEEIVYGFDEDSPFALPSLDALIPLVRGWLAGDQQELGAFYTPEEFEDPPGTPLSERPPTHRGPGRRATSSGGQPKAKRPTTASLAVEMKQLVEYLPKISEQLAALSHRQDLVENRLALPMPSASMISSRPLGAPPAAPLQPHLGSLAKSMGAPPRTTSAPSLGLLGTLSENKPLELQGLETEKLGVEEQLIPSGDRSLALAVLEQSKALTSLVSQIAAAQSDPMADLSSGSSASTRGAAGRVRLQSELAQQKETFFQAVLLQMARRMSPTSTVDVSPQVLMDRGVSGTRYLERFGGYSRHRELGQLQYQVMTVFDYMLQDNMPAAKDALALLAVSIEQAALDNGRMDLAMLLCLQEDPPAGIFQNRQIASTSRARSFVPLADQKWITCALAFLKELEVITAKRAELAGPSQPASTASSEAPKPKPKGKKGGRGKGRPEPEDAET